MNRWIEPVPVPNTFTVDWQCLRDSYAWIRKMTGCPQDPYFHAEGDVDIHTRMAAEAMAADPRWQAYPAQTRELLFAAVLLHDVGKPDCTRKGADGRITSKGHSKRGEILARNILYRLDSCFQDREHVARLIRAHQAPFHFIKKEDMRRDVIGISAVLNCQYLSLLAQADARGRVCENNAETLHHLALFEEYCQELRCWNNAYPFPSDLARFLYLRGDTVDPGYKPYEQFKATVILLSGLPGAGKDEWINEHIPDWPVISLDAIRHTLKIRPTDPQGEVVAAAREQARRYLRKGISFAWNATNVTRLLRSQNIDLFAKYGARIKLVYVEVPFHRLEKQNQQRTTAVPKSVMETLFDRWEVPEPGEAHEVIYAVKESPNDRFA